MDRRFPQPNRKGATAWDRLKPVKQDPLESMGFVSKGDTRLLDVKSQESFYNKIVARYMQFCTRHAKDLDNAFASLSVRDQRPELRNPKEVLPDSNLTAKEMERMMPRLSDQSYLARPNSSSDAVASPATELSTILIALRKLREGLLASQKQASSPVFSQRVHIFNIRLAVLALHPESYHPPLLHLLFDLHTAQHPLPLTELTEMTTYLILDTATRQNDLVHAYTLRHASRVRFGFNNHNLDMFLRSMVTNNWILFWRVRRKVDGYVRAILHWQEERLRKTVLKAIGRTYLTCDMNWIVHGASGGEMSWDTLAELENIGWLREGDKVNIRKPKPRATENTTAGV